MSKAKRAAGFALATLFVFAPGCDASQLILGDVNVGATDPKAAESPEGRWRGKSAGPRSPSKPLVRVPCPEKAVGHEAALDAADRLYEAADLPAALACAELASEFAPQAVEAHHLRGAALATMGYLAEAQVAFAMALALDPDDPETLAASADFYINVVSPRAREQLLLGLEYARRGSERAATRRRSDRQLRARLSLLVGSALNDLGSSDLAMAPIGEALRLSPGWLEAEHERGVALFNLCKFDQAASALTNVTTAAPNDPYANYYLGLIAERFEAESAAKHFAIARDIAPNEYFAPPSVNAKEFHAELDLAVGQLSPTDAEILAAVSLEVAAFPSLEDLTAVDPPFAPTITGLYRGLPVGVDGEPRVDVEAQGSGDVLVQTGGEIPPRAIVLYRQNLVRGSKTRAELNVQIRRTLAHELGHAKGLDEDQLRGQGLE